jgi:hypothetical protein
MKAVENLFALRDQVDVLNASQKAFFRFLDNAMENCKQSGNFKPSSDDGKNLQALADVFERDLQMQVEKISKSLVDLKEFIDR